VIQARSLTRIHFSRRLLRHACSTHTHGPHAASPSPVPAAPCVCCASQGSACAALCCAARAHACSTTRRTATQHAVHHGKHTPSYAGAQATTQPHTGGTCPDLHTCDATTQSTTGLCQRCACSPQAEPRQPLAIALSIATRSCTPPPGHTHTCHTAASSPQADSQEL
jgi:hypothetical protein